MKNGTIGALGAILGFSVVLGLIIVNDPQLKEEASKQVKSTLKSTKKIVNHYRNASQRIAPEEYEPTTENSKYEQEWEVTLQQAQQHQN